MFGHPEVLDAAVAELTATGLTGWALVGRAQQFVHQRFGYYSCLHWWEPPFVALARGRGYCAQYNRVLAKLLRQLGFECRLVHAFRVRLLDDPAWRMGHVWVRVRISDEGRDICAGATASQPGRARFEPLTKVRGFSPAMRLVTTLGMAPIVGLTLARSAITGKPQPGWIHHPMDA